MNDNRSQLANQFMRLHELFVRYWMRTHTHGVTNPYKGQGRVLSILKLQPEIVQKELGYLLDMSKQALAELLNKLEKGGYITRAQSEKDGRSFVIKLTEKGREAIPENCDDKEDVGIEEFFDGLNDEEQKTLLLYLERIIGAIEEKNSSNEDDYAEFFRRRFFARHGRHMRGGFGGAFGGFTRCRKHGCSGGSHNENDS